MSARFPQSGSPIAYKIKAAVNGVFNKFVYVQSLGGFYYQPSHASNGWFLASE